MGESFPYVTAVYQHVGDRFTQVGDQDLGTLDLLSFEPNTIGGPLTQDTFTYDPKLPAYNLLNVRAGVRRKTSTLREELLRAIEAEEYEKAATIRDEIRVLEDDGVEEES